jgi:hypothetical protein
MQFLLCLEVPHQLRWWTLLAISAAPQQASQGTFECMDSAGLPSQPGSWFVHKEAAVLS